MNKIKISFDIKRLVDSIRVNKPFYGIDQYIVNIVNELEKREDVELRLVVNANLLPSRENYAMISEIYIAIIKLEKKLGIEIHFANKRNRAYDDKIKRLAESNLTKSAIGKKLCLIQIALIMKKKSIQSALSYPVYKSSDIYYSPVNPLPSKKITGKALRFLTVHDIIHRTNPEFNPMGFRPPAINAILSSINKSTDYIISDSDYTRKELIDNSFVLPEKVHTIYLSADEKFRRPKKSIVKKRLEEKEVEPDSYIMALGQFEIRKNLFSLLEAYRQVIINNIDLAKYKLVLCTDKKTKVKLEDFADRINLDKSQIVYYYNVTNEELASFYSNALLFAYVSYAEGFGIPILEAMSSGCPVITSDCTSMPEVGRNSCLYVNPYKVNDIVEKLTFILQDSKYRKKLIKKGLSNASDFTWEVTANNLVNHFKDKIYRQ